MDTATEGITLARQLPWLRSASRLFRKVTVIAAGGALCVGLAATGTAATLTGAASSAQAGSFYPATGHSGRPTLVSLARQAALIRPLHRASLLVEVRLREIARRTLRIGSQRQTVHQTVTAESVTPTGPPREIASAMLAQRGWTGQFSCLDSLWEHESGWNVYAENPSSGAYGIAQALPGSQMASAGPDWHSSAATQIRWGLNYIQNRYGSPCGAWDHEEATGWY